MTETIRVFQRDRQAPRFCRAAVLLAVSLIAIRLVAALICASCFSDFEKAQTRAFYLHSGWDQDRCHHGLAPVSPWIAWACAVNEDDSAFALPAVPRLPVLASVFVPLTLLLVSYRTRAVIIPTGRGPPPCGY